MGALNRQERNRDPWRQTTLVARKRPCPAAVLHRPNILLDFLHRDLLDIKN